MADNDIKIDIELEARNAIKSLNKIQDEIKATGKESKSSGKNTTSFLTSIKGPAAAAAAAIAGIGFAAKSFIDAASTIEDLETQFISFTGSAESAARQVERIAEFSASTPFQLEDLANANRTLLAFGSSTEESLVQLKQLGEVAAGTGNNVGELAQIFGQIQVAGKLTGERFNQLAERGVNLGPVLAKSLGVAETALEGMRKRGEITADDVAKAFEQMTGEGGQFSGAMQRQSETLNGSFSTLKDNIFLLQAAIGEALAPAASYAAKALTSAAKATTEVVSGSEVGELTAKIKQLSVELKDLEAGGLGLAELLGFDVGPERITEIKEELKKLNAELEVAKQREATAGGPVINGSPEQQALDDAGGGAEVDQAAIDAARKTSEELLVIQEQRIANEQAIEALAAQNKSDTVTEAERLKNEQLIEILEEKNASILEKEAEKDALLLEQQGLYEEAARLQAEAALKKRQKAQDKARKEEFNAFIQTQKAKQKFESQTWMQRGEQTKQGLQYIADLQSSKSKEAFQLGKAAAIAQTLIDIPMSAQKAYTSLAGIPYVGVGLGIAAAAAAVAAGGARLSQIKSAQFTGYAEGGVVTGGVAGKDSVPALLTPGEVVVPEKNFKDIGLDNTDQVMILADIRSLLGQIAGQERPLDAEGGGEAGTQQISIDLVLDREVLASQILELNRDNVRIA